MEGLHGKVALVTGASRGIGKAVAVELARAGADVVVAARTVEARANLPGTVNETVAEIESLGRRALAVRTDVALVDDLDALAATALGEMGRVDVLVNNAAYTSGSVLTLPVWEMTREAWELQFATNVHAPFSLVKALAPAMREHGGGVVVNMTARGAGLQPVDDVSRFGKAGPWVYGTTKAALNRLGNALAQQLRPDGIAVISVEPGFVRTEFMDLMSERGVVDVTDAIPMRVPARVVAHLAASGDALRWTGQVVSAPDLFEELGLG
jgi:NAD(P)-dependent dehydrogenase (short-subunit alcohol dehydrogenase family)